METPDSPSMTAEDKSLQAFTHLSASLYLPRSASLWSFPSFPPASSRPDQDVGGIQRDQRQKAASREPQTHRNGE